MRLLSYLQSIFEDIAFEKFKLSAIKIYTVFGGVVFIWLDVIHRYMVYDSNSIGMLAIAFGNELGIQLLLFNLIEVALNKIYGIPIIVKLLILTFNYFIVYIFYSAIYYKIIKIFKGNTTFDSFSKSYLLIESLSFFISTSILYIMIIYFNGVHIINPYEYIISNYGTTFFFLSVYILYWIFISLCHISMLRSMTDLSFMKIILVYIIATLPESLFLTLMFI